MRAKASGLSEDEWFEAAKTGDVKRVQRFIRAGFPLNKRQSNNEMRPTALELATYCGRVAVMDVLLSAKARQLREYGTLLDAAIAGGSRAAVARLLDHGVSIRGADGNGITPLMRAIACDRETIAEDLLKRGAVPTIVNDFGETALHMAAEKGFVALCQQLMEAGCDAAAANGEGQTPLVLASGRGRVGVVTFFLRRLKAIAKEELDRALGEAAMTRRYDTCRVLLEAGATLDWRNHYGISPLDYAADSDDLSLLSLFLRSGWVRPKSRTVIQARAAAREKAKRKAIEMLDGFDRGLTTPKVVPPVAPEPSIPKALLRFAKDVGGRASAKKGEFRIRLEQRNGREIVDGHQERLLRAGYYLVHNLAGDYLIAIPGQDKFGFLRRADTVGDRLENKEVIAWFEKLERTHPFTITGAESLWVEGRFLNPVQDEEALARWIKDFAPDTITEAGASLRRFAQKMKRTRRFVLVWDV